MPSAFQNPSLRIELDGAPLEPSAQASVTSVVVRQRLSTPSAAEIAFADKPPASALRIGCSLRLSLSDQGELFDGEIIGVDYGYDDASGRAVHVRAFDQLHRLKKNQRARVTSNCSVAKFISSVVEEAGIASEITEPGPERRCIAQYDQSDFDVILELATEAGLYFQLSRGKFRLISLAGSGEPVELTVGRGLSRVRAFTSAETMRRGSQATAWDVLRTRVHQGAAIAARQRAVMPALDVSSLAAEGERYLFNRSADGPDGPGAITQADLDRAAGREISVEATADGNPEIWPGRIVHLTGLDDALDGRFTVAEAIHLFTSERGYVTEFNTRTPKFDRPGRGTPLFTFGPVTDVDDPDKLSRVRAKLVLCGEVESDWLPVVIPGAGAEKGLAVLPEVGDDVLIVFPHGDLAYGVVLGGLYGESKAPGLVDSGARPFAFRTRSGQAITLDEENGLARIETRGGDIMEIGPKGALIRAAADLVIEAPGRTLTIRANAIEFEQG
jgi:phage baseplate assembly protein V